MTEFASFNNKQKSNESVVNPMEAEELKFSPKEIVYELLTHKQIQSEDYDKKLGLLLLGSMQFKEEALLYIRALSLEPIQSEEIKNLINILDTILSGIGEVKLIRPNDYHSFMTNVKDLAFQINQ